MRPRLTRFRRVLALSLLCRDLSGASARSQWRIWQRLAQGRFAGWPIVVVSLVADRGIRYVFAAVAVISGPVHCGSQIETKVMALKELLALSQLKLPEAQRGDSLVLRF